MRKSKIKQIINEVAEEFGLPLNGGNAFEKSKEMEMREQTLQLYKHHGQMTTSSISGFVSQKLTTLVPMELVFFRNYANIFTSLIRFKTDDIILKEQLIKMIRTAFYSGEAGLVLDEGQPYAVNVERYDKRVNMRGDYQFVFLSDANKILQANKKPSPSKNPVKKMLKYENGLCTNFISFKWTAEALSAWLWLWPYVLQKHKLQKQLALTTHFLNKKLEYKIKDPTMIKRDVELMMDPDVPFIVNVGSEENPATNRIKWLNDGLDYTDNILNYINGWEALTEREFGIRNNIDRNTNKDRSLTGEVEASQSYYDNSEYAIMIEWDLFVAKAQKLGLDLDLVKDINEDWEEEAEETAQNENGEEENNAT